MCERLRLYYVSNKSATNHKEITSP
jgi:hypothetical protein